MALSLVEQVRIRIFDIPRNLFYPIFTDEEYEDFLESANNDVLQAAKIAAVSASMFFATINTKEMVGDTEIWNEVSRHYLRALELFLRNNQSVLLKGVMPYAAGISVADLRNSRCDPDNPRTQNWLYKDKKGCENTSGIYQTHPSTIAPDNGDGDNSGGCCV